MIDDLAGRSPGERIQFIRERRGLSREVAAGLLGRSTDWLKKVEKGKLQPPRLPMMLKIAQMLGVQDLAELTGAEVAIPTNSFSRIPHPSIPAVRDAMLDPMLSVTLNEEPDSSRLQQRSAHAWQVWHRSAHQRTEIGRILPTLIRDCRIAARATDGQERRKVNVALADAYFLGEQLLAWTSAPELVWLVADRGISAAQDADTPESLAGAAWVAGNVRRAVGDYDGALGLVEEAKDILAPRLEGGADDLHALWGALHLHGAVTAARAGREGDAWRYWDEGQRTAERLPNGYMHSWTVFSHANVDIHGVSIGADLSKSGEARHRAEQISPETMPSLERRARLYIEIARAYRLQRDWGSVVRWLLDGCEISLEAVNYTPVARSMAAEAVDEGGPLVQRQARELAARLSIPI